MDDTQLLRYSRHILLDSIGIEGQQAFLNAHAVLIGAGGLGSPAALYLASAGVGRITLIDPDTVELTNLQRQIAHTDARLGWKKVDSAAAALRARNPDITLVLHAARATPDTLREWLADADVVLDCSDNFATRHAVNAAACATGTPLVSGAAIGFDGQISVFDPSNPHSPCYACLFPPEQEFEEALCSTMGVFAPLVGIIGTMQAAEALKLIAGIGPSLAGRLLLLDAQRMEWNSLRIDRNPDCPHCQNR